CRQGTLLSEDPIHRAYLQSLAGLVSCSKGDYEEAAAHVAEGFDELAEALDPDAPEAQRIEARLLRTRGNIWLGARDPRKALEHYREALALLEPLPEPWERSIAAFNLGEAYLHLDDAARALEHLERAFAEKTTLGDRWGLAHVHHARSRLHRRRGDTASAMREARVGIRLATRIEDPKIEAKVRIELALALRDRGEPQRAERELLRALRKAEAASAHPEIDSAQRAIRDLRQSRGDPSRPEPLDKTGPAELAREGGDRSSPDFSRESS
ncbi:MAG: tetratricopeptide repeat protein, partial [Holophagales bacterium]|nr:tetratricopeptide repeat protein [Holophagales bacterium]